jgi:hypothetical protein
MDRSVFLLGVAAALAAAALPRIGAAQTMSVPDAIARLFNAPDAQPAWFSAAFLAAVPIEKVQTIIAGIKANLGAYQSAALIRGRYTLTFARGSIRADAALDEGGAFTTLLVNNMISTDAMDRITALLRSDTVPAAWFSDQFLTVAPVERTDALIARMKTQFGAYQRLAPSTDGSYIATFANGAVDVSIHLSADGKIDGLLFKAL